MTVPRQSTASASTTRRSGARPAREAVMAAWVFLAGAIATEVLGTLQLHELANGFRVLPATIVTVSYVASFVLMVPALRTINVGVSYAIWSAVGTAAVAGLGGGALRRAAQRPRGRGDRADRCRCRAADRLREHHARVSGAAQGAAGMLYADPFRRTRPRQSAPPLVRTRRSRHRMLPFTWETLRLFLHILAATIWVGGQADPRRARPDPAGDGRAGPEGGSAAVQPGRVAGLRRPRPHRDLEHRRRGRQAVRPRLPGHPRGIKMALVLVFGVSAFLHTRAQSKSGLARGAPWPRSVPSAPPSSAACSPS